MISLLFDDRKFETARRFQFENLFVIRRFNQMSFALLDIFDEWTTCYSTNYVLWILMLLDVFDRWIVRFSTMLSQKLYRWKIRYSTSLLNDFNSLSRRSFRLEHRFSNNMCESQKFRLCEILKSCERKKRKKIEKKRKSKKWLSCERQKIEQISCINVTRHVSFHNILYCSSIVSFSEINQWTLSWCSLELDSSSRHEREFSFQTFACSESFDEKNACSRANLDICELTLNKS